MSYYFIIFAFIIAVIAIIYIWHVSKQYTSISDDKILLLDTNDDRILSDWYYHHIKQSFDFDLNLDTYDISSKFINRIYNIDIDPNLLVVGLDIKSQYFYKTTNILPLFSDSTKHDCFFDIRSLVGKEGEIAIIYDSKVRSFLRNNNNNYDITNLNSIIDNNLDIKAKEYLVAVLKYRNDTLTSLNYPGLLNIDGTYAYFENNNIPNVETLKTKFGYRINLLCTDLEFDTLIKRLKDNLSMKYSNLIN